MLATPAASPPAGAGWLHEVKWDGVRVLADVRDSQVDLRARSGAAVTAAYPELDALRSAQDCLLDGEVVALRDGVPSFSALAERMHVRDARRAAALARREPVVLIVFDVLRRYGVDLTSRPLTERRAVLERMDLPGIAGDAVQVPPAFDDGAALMVATAEQGLEGVVSKRAGSSYQPGRRSPDWVKVPHRRTRTALVGGWRPVGAGEGRSGPGVGSLLLGAPDDDGALRMLGRAGSGITGAMSAELLRRLRPLERATSPFSEPVPREDARGATWVEPDVVVEVLHLARTPSGRLRHPVVRGVRDDVGADGWEGR